MVLINDHAATAGASVFAIAARAVWQRLQPVVSWRAGADASIAAFSGSATMRKLSDEARGTRGSSASAT